MAIKSVIKPMKVAFISTYLPRKCGIATFTNDLYNSIKKIYVNGGREKNEEYLQVIAMNNTPEGYAYSKDVCFSIREKYRDDYRRVADYINLSQIDVVSLQHEFGIFGGEEGSYILHLLGKLKKPVVTTLHTIMKDPLPDQKKTLTQVCAYSTVVVVISHKAKQLLKDIYDVPEKKITMIHHGAHDVPFLDSSYFKEQFKAEGRQVILTFGLLDDNKGIEYVIDALPEVTKKFPDVLFFVLGTTHPEVKKLYGEQYRHTLQKRVKEKGLSRNVVFHNHFVSLEQLIQFLVAADIYITPYLGKERISSGTLAYALASGKAIISTPYVYAEDLLGEDRGLFVPFKDSAAIAEKLILLMEDENLRNRIRKNAYQYGRQMIWREVANDYARAFELALYDYGNLSVNNARIPGATLEPVVLPEVNLKQLQILSDDTGIFQHAVFTIPARSCGYSTDDNARALTVAIMNWHLFQDEDILPLMHTYFSFLNYALDEKTGMIRNYMSYNREWLEDVGSEDSHGRSIWALGYAVAHPPNNAMLGLAIRLFRQAIDATFRFKSPRAWAFTINGSLKYLERFNGETQVHDVVVQLSQRLYRLYKDNSTDEWPWFEDILTYDNARLAEALIAAGGYLKNREMQEFGLKALEWLISVQTDPQGGHPSFVGSREWYRKGREKSRFDQQPLEATALIDASHQAYMATNDSKWRSMMDWVFNWFFGNNDIHQSLYDFSTGGCYDSLQPAGVNQNQGGESVVSFLLSLHRMHHIAHEQALHDINEHE